MYGTNDYDAFYSIVYADTDNLTEIGTYQATEHSAVDQAEPEYIDLSSNVTAFRYYVLKIADNWGHTNVMGMRRLQLQTEDGYDSATYTEVYPTAHTTDEVKATTTYSANYNPWFATDPTSTVTGAAAFNSWVATEDDKQKFNIDLGSGKVVKKIRIVNYHDSGTDTSNGVKAVKIYGSNDSSALSDTVYTSEDYLYLLTEVEVKEHSAVDEEDAYEFDVYNDHSFRYYILRIEDNWDTFVPAGFRSVELLTQDGFTAVDRAITHHIKYEQATVDIAYDDISKTIIGEDVSAPSMSATDGWDGISAHPSGSSKAQGWAPNFTLPFKTISMWVKAVNDANDLSGILNGSLGVRLQIQRLNTTNPTELRLGATLTGHIVGDYDWHHIAITEGSDDDHHYIWLDGVKSATEFETLWGGEIANVGNDVVSTAYQMAALDNTQIYDRVLDDADVIALADATSQDTIYTPPGAAPPDAEALLSYVEQPYSIGIDPVLGYTEQPYMLVDPQLVSANYQPYRLVNNLLGYTRQYYYQTISNFVKQPYGDAAVVASFNYQYYGESTKLVKANTQPYGKASELVGIVEQPYHIKGGISSAVRQPYTIARGAILGATYQPYSALVNVELMSAVRQSYGLFTAVEPVDTTGGSITWEGADGEVATLSHIAATISYSVSQYCGTLNATSPNYDAWSKINLLDAIIFTYGGTSYHFLVTKLIEMETGGTQFTYGIEGRSRAILLDFPHAAQIADDSLLPDNASSLVTAIAALEGETVSWNLDVDPMLTEDQISLEGGSPKDAIKSIANAYGGYIKSMPDGTISVEKTFLYDTDKYYEDSVSIQHAITAGTDVAQYQSYTDNKEGYNKFSVDESETTTGYTLEAEEVSSTKKKVKAYKVPWDSAPVTLLTSETTNVRITALGEQPETIEEETIEIVKGTGSVSKPVYGSVSADYNDSTNLGSITAEEDGTLTTAVSGNSLVDVTYTTRYWLWEVTDTDVEPVQLILVTD